MAQKSQDSTHIQTHMLYKITFVEKTENTHVFSQKLPFFYDKWTFLKKKLPPFIKKYIWHIYKKNQTSDISFYKKFNFFEKIETPDC